MALIRIDWNPSAAKIRQFGWMLCGFSLLLGGFWAWRGRGPWAWYIAGAGLPLGVLTAVFPEALGRRIYKVWMGAAFIIGSVVSPLIMGFLYYGMVTPFAIVMKLAGRDALRLKRPRVESYWTALSIPEDKSYFERLF